MPPTSTATVAPLLQRLTSYRNSHIFRIEGNYYDLSDFADRHPGGKEFLRYAKIKNWDHTQVFAIHHLNYPKVERFMKQFRITDESVITRIEELALLDLLKYWPKQIPKKDSKYYPFPAQYKHAIPENALYAGAVASVETQASDPSSVYSRIISKNYGAGISWDASVLKVADMQFTLPVKGGFFWDFRAQVHAYFAAHECSYTDPPWHCMLMFYVLVATNFACIALQYFVGGSIALSLFTGIAMAWVGGYGHQFFHLPHYRVHAHILDWYGMYSHAFLTDHVFEHHIHTNTVADNHFDGTDPFLRVNPFAPRNILQHWFTFVIMNIALMLGIFGNYLYNWMNILRGGCEFHWCICFLPFNFFVHMLVTDWFTGIYLTVIELSVLSWYYFHIALMNHNQSENWDLEKIWNAKDFSEMQLVTSTDIGSDYGYLGSMLCLWLNYHTIHHLLPTVDMSHHQSVQKILKRVAKKHGVSYNHKPITEMYFQMMQTFSMARAFEVVKHP